MPPLSFAIFALASIALSLAQKIPANQACVFITGNYPFQNNQVYCPRIAPSGSIVSTPTVVVGNQGATVVFDKQIFLFGGQRCKTFDNNVQNITEQSASCTAGQVAIDIISSFNPTTAAVVTGQAHLAQARYGHTATLFGDSVWICGGGHDTQVVGNCGVYMPRGNYLVNADDVKPMPVPVTNHVAVVLGANTGTKLVIVGGGMSITDNTQLSQAVQIYDPVTNQWTQGTQAPFKNVYAAAAAKMSNAELLMCGGMNAAAQASADCWVYNVVTNNWTKKGTMSKGRHSHTMTSLLGQIIIIGGAGTGDLSHGFNDAELWDRNTNSGHLYAQNLAENALFSASAPIEP